MIRYTPGSLQVSDTETGGAFEIHEESLPTFRQVTLVIVRKHLWRRRRQIAEEGSRLLDFIPRDFRIRRWVGIGRNRVAADRFLDWGQRRRHAHLLREGPGVEIKKRRNGRFATEPPDATVDGAVGMAK